MPARRRRCWELTRLALPPNASQGERRAIVRSSKSPSATLQCHLHHRGCGGRIGAVDARRRTLPLRELPTKWRVVRQQHKKSRTWARSDHAAPRHSNKGGSVMARLNRRLLLRRSLGAAVAASLGRPFLANAAVTTVSVWWPQGFVREEDIGFRAVVDGYEKASGNKIDFTLIPFAPLMQKIVGALTTGDVPDVMSHDTAPATVIPQNAWNDKLVDLSDVVETQKSHYHPTALLASQYYNNVTKKRSVYYAPYKTAVLPFHIWNSLVEKAGYKLADAPKTWDAFWDFFKPMQKKLRDKNTRGGVYALGLQPTTTGPADGNNMFHYFLVAYGGNGIVTPDGKTHLDDPQGKEAVIRALTYITTAYTEGYVPPGALSRSD